MTLIIAAQVQRFGSGGNSYVHPVIAVAALVAAVLQFLLPRKWSFVPFLAGAVLIPMDQVVVIGGLHFQMIRILILAGWISLFARGGAKRLPGGMKPLDWALVLSFTFAAIDTILLWQTSAAFTNQLGSLYTAFGVFFLLRYLIRDQDDVIRAIKALAYISAFIAVVMSIEHLTRHNPYAYVWPTAGEHTVMERDGQLRAMACFAHPLLAGTFGGISLPLFLALWWKNRKYRRTAMLGLGSATIIVLAANSSTPLLAYAGGLVAICFWPMRRQMRAFRWGMAIVLTLLHLSMKAPVWALIARVDLTGSSSGYHRYQLVDQFIRHFGDWWLLGTKGNQNWGWDMWDLANQYVAVGETSGLLPFLFFLAIIIYGFKYMGRARRAARTPREEKFIWALGSALFANVVAFFGISYYDQTMVAWYLLLAMISACYTAVMKNKRVTVKMDVRDWTASEVEVDSPAPSLVSRSGVTAIKTANRSIY